MSRSARSSRSNAASTSRGGGRLATSRAQPRRKLASASRGGLAAISGPIPGNTSEWRSVRGSRPAGKICFGSGQIAGTKAVNPA